MRRKGSEVVSDKAAEREVHGWIEILGLARCEAAESWSGLAVRSLGTGTRRMREASGARIRQIASQSLSCRMPRMRVGLMLGKYSVSEAARVCAPAML